MEEIYWITRLDAVNTLLIILIAISTCLSVISGIAYIAVYNENHTDEAWQQLWKKLLKYCTPTTLIVSLIFVFTPTTKEAFMIWGVGNVIDYVQTNETVKQLPDKVMNALDIWVDSYIQTDSIK